MRSFFMILKVKGKDYPKPNSHRGSWVESPTVHILPVTII